MKTIYVGKEAAVAFRADEGSQTVWVSVEGREVPLAAQAAQRAARKLAEAAKRARAA